MRTRPGQLDFRARFERRPFLQHHRQNLPGQRFHLILKIDETRAFQRPRLIRRNHLIQRGLQRLRNPGASVLACRSC